MAFGSDRSTFTDNEFTGKRAVEDKNLGPLVKTVMTRCIHCTRCVRFSTEIAGTEDIGMFGRGLDSEIGTYVKKIFQSELSGNVIDLCPVGALTQKPYPFLSRKWELKTVKSIDFTDGYGTNLLIYIKNNKIVKINPGYGNSNYWISDKSRFSFDGIFSHERSLNGFIKFGKKNYGKHKWDSLVKEVILTLYFQDHLNNHFLKNYKLAIIFGNNTGIETLNLLNLFSKKYKFIILRKFEGQLNINTFEDNFLSKQDCNTKIALSNLCLLVGTNPRYESTNFNLLLRQKYLKGEFKTFLIGSNKDITFSKLNFGLNIKTLLNIVEGNHYFCVDFAESKYPLITTSSYNLYRKDYEGISYLLNYLHKILSKVNFTSIKLNVLNSSLNESGINYLNNFKTINEQDLVSSSGIFLLNSPPNSQNLNKLIRLKLLNYLKKNYNWPKYCLDQSNGLESITSKSLQNSDNVYNYINLPNNSFFESSNTYITTQGFFKNTVKFISTTNQSKEDWQIIRKIFSNITNINFFTSSYNKYIINSKSNFNLFKNLTTLIYYSTNIINSKTSFSIIQNCKKVYEFESSLKLTKKKLSLTKLNIWLNDFYIGGNDCYSKHSPTMISCSKILRLNKHNFSHLS